MYYKTATVGAALLVAIALCACTDAGREASTEATSTKATAQPVDDELGRTAPKPVAPANAPARHAFFGDLHIHSSWSFDAYAFGVSATPQDAYRYARGEAIDHVSGNRIQLRHGALDFIALTDHAEYMGFAVQAREPGSVLAELPLAKALVSSDPRPHDADPLRQMG